MRARPLAGIAALVITAAALILWFAGRDEQLPATGVTQNTQVEDLRVTLWLDQDAAWVARDRTACDGCRRPTG